MGVALMAIMASMKLLPYIVAGIQTIHGDAVSGADKKTLALESLTLVSGVAGAVLPPEEAAMATVAYNIAGNAIDLIVQGFKMKNIFGFKTKPTIISTPTVIPGVV